MTKENSTSGDSKSSCALGEGVVKVDQDCKSRVDVVLVAHQHTAIAVQLQVLRGLIPL